MEGELDISQVAPSMYLPILAMKNLRPKQNVESIAIVGTTCQLLAASKLLKGRVDKIIRIAIFCKQQKHLGFTHFIKKRLRINTNEPVAEVEYRGSGWPGKMSINKHSLDYEMAAAIPFGKRLWCLPACNFCPSPFGYKADLTLADPWGIEPSEGSGKTMAIAWTSLGQELLRNTLNLEFKPGLDISSIKGSIDWKSLLRKNELTKYYLGEKVPIALQIAGLSEKVQTRFLEQVLSSIRLPALLYKVIAHLPNLQSIISAPKSVNE
ncbi:hypothetical protein DSCOOX_60580 [Desulfosarcina ovata subsp. ovata]|uniref:Coenzyme F420 hydrogenase/dehydrogenase beta subunit C-terminal domain-containing protein n=2 Tax=Desulfosarcina ovata TaxID=83564 RepID=A0A5K8AJV0_9BACT|nr:hypothetical protein DSCOOX_60580 [Desulfosarcina ovata subsp. ovata]